MRIGYRSGCVGIVGRPNVGKSTLLNYYVGEKVAIVSPRPQTTRHRILGICTRQDAQIIFLDTPGLHEPQHVLGRYLQEVVKAVVLEADLLLAVIDARSGIVEEDQRIFDRLKHALQPLGAGKTQRPCLLAINKVDLVKKPLLLPLLEACAKTALFADCVPVSALTGDQMDVLLDCLISKLPAGPRWYEPTQRTDQTSRQLVSELIREQVLLATRQEVPQAVAVLVDEMDDRQVIFVIRATIVVDRSGQKAIVIGHGGAMLKRIGQAARLHIERLLKRRVYLQLWVKVAEGWRNDPQMLRALGYITGQRE